MDLLRPLMSALGSPSSRLQGIVVPTTAGATTLSVNVNGNVIPARVIDPLVVAAGDPVAVDFISGPQGQAEAWIVGRLASAPRPPTGTVATVPPSSDTITVTGADGATYTAYFLSSYTPTVGDLVALQWNAGTPTVVGKVGATPAAQTVAAVAAPPAPASTGTSTYACTDSSTYWPSGGWDSWAGGNNVYQGQYGGQGELTGAWFYGGSPKELNGRTITAIRFTLGARNGAGSSGSPVTVNLHTHTSSSRPDGNVALGSGSATVTAQPWQGATVYSLPTSFATDLLNGGGIALYGDPYAGFNGRNLQPNSGLLSIDWQE